MSLKYGLRSLNRQFRHIPLYDRAYRYLHASYKLTGQDKGASFYHKNYDKRPVEPGLVLLDSFWGRMIGCNPYALYLQMRADARCVDFRYVWVCNDKATIPADVNNDSRVRFVSYQSIAYQIALLQAEYVIGNSNFPLHFAKKPDQIYVNTWHGTPIKHLGRDAEVSFLPSANTQKNFLCSDFIFSASSTMTRRTVVAYNAESALQHVYETGTPRIDLTLSTTRDHARTLLSTIGDKPVLLYAPTWRGTFTHQNIEITRQIATIKAVVSQLSDSYEVFVSVHHITQKALKDRNVKFRSIPKNIPINHILAGVDILISDYSSIVIDYLCLDRPIVLFCPDFENFASTQGLYDDLGSLPVAFCQTPDDLIDVVKQASKPSDFPSYPQYYEMFLKKEDGKVSARALDIIFDRTPAQAYPEIHRKKILIYAGGMIPNGITSSIIALTNAIDHNAYDISIVFNATTADKDVDRQFNIEKLHKSCKLITRVGSLTFTAEERLAYREFCERGAFNDGTQRARIDAAFDREVTRIFGNLHFDVAIDFSGYGPFWTYILSKVKADRHLIYQQSDMYREAYNPSVARKFPDLPAVFSLYERFDGVVSVSQEMSPINRENLKQYYHPKMEFLSAQNVILPDVIQKLSEMPLENISAQVSDILGRQDIYKFCCVARLSPEKNHSRLLAAFAKVIRSNPRCVLFILGAGVLENELHEQARQLGINSQVIFLGHCENPYPIIGACDCAVLASEYEGQGIVLLEALALGVRCIATDCPAIQNVLKNNVGTIIPQDTDALAAAMLEASFQNDAAATVFDIRAYANSALKQFYACLKI